MWQAKSEIQSPKSETNLITQIPMRKNRSRRAASRLLCALIWISVISICFGYRVSEFGFAAPAADEPLADQVRNAIDRGVRYLKNHQKSDGAWETQIIANQPGGESALAMLALLNAGVKTDDAVIKKGLDYVRKLENSPTYVRALQTMVLVEAGQSQDLELIQQNVKHFLKVAVRDGNGNLLGWGYDRSGQPGLPDNSNTQYAVLALWVARKSGTDKSNWELVRDMYTRSQLESGSWSYSREGAGAFAGERSERLTMVSAGLSGLYMAQMELNAGRENLDPVSICGRYEENEALKRGLAWISPTVKGMDRFVIDMKTPPAGGTFYNLYGVERLGRLSGLRFLGAHDWYREGCAWLVKHQHQEDGSWHMNQTFDMWPNVSTSFAVLFLSKGRTPVLISKLAHGSETRGQEDDQDWNRRHNDLRHLVDFASDKVFKKMPLAWQIFDVRRQPSVTPQRLDELTSELLQSPILYLTGHQSPAKRLSGVEKNLLKTYVENGGFILAVACCDRKDFSDGFQELCQELWPYNDLTDLEADHPIWSMRFEVKPNAFRFKGIQQGCKTVAILCQENLCGYWEINRHRGEGETAFELGANIIAYATGLEPPKPRLTPMSVVANVKDNPLASPPRGYFQVGQLIGQVGEEATWKPAPQAMSKLMQNLRDVAGLDVAVKTVNVPIDHNDLTQFKFLYMHGRKDFRFSSQQLERLRFNLKNGGLLFADACCGKEDFDKGFRQFIVDMFPKEAFPGTDPPRLVPIGPSDPLFSKELNGEALTEANIQCRTERGAALRAIRPALEGVKIGGRWAVIYSKYDIGCALEKHQSADCIGYSYESAMRLGRAAVLYQLRP
jgi:hypothetical protein